MPVLEALAAGIPTACSSIEPLKSVAGSAALLFDPSDEAAILDAVVRITCDEELRARLSTAGPVRASQFSWRKAAEQTLDLLQEAAASARAHLPESRRTRGLLTVVDCRVLFADADRAAGIGEGLPVGRDGECVLV